jgi:hypothetical protein
MYFEILGGISQVETIATGRGIRRLNVLRKRYGGRNWRKQKGIASVRLADGGSAGGDSLVRRTRSGTQGLEVEALPGRVIMATKGPSRFVLCIRAEDLDDLEPRKIYEVIPDTPAKRDGFLRVIDDSGEDYLYPADCFVSVALPVAVAKELSSRRAG